MNQPTSPTKRRWLPYALGLALIVLLGFGLRPRPSPVETALAATGPLRATVSEEGKTRATIAAGDVVAVIEPMAASPLDTRSRALAEARRDSAVATLEKTRAAHALAVSELKRVQRMFDAGTVSPQDIENAQLRETTAAREIIVAEGALRAAVAELAVVGPDTLPALIEVRAPVGGRVLHVFQESERPVTAGTPLLDAGDPADLEVVIELLSRDGAALAPGARVELEQWGGPQPLMARVRLVEPAAFTKISALGVEEQRVNVVADIITPVAERPTLLCHVAGPCSCRSRPASPAAARCRCSRASPWATRSSSTPATA
jgi:HlyD family secretion protein